MREESCGRTRVLVFIATIMTFVVVLPPWSLSWSGQVGIPLGGMLIQITGSVATEVLVTAVLISIYSLLAFAVTSRICAGPAGHRPRRAIQQERNSGVIA